jgi:uncharacterized membrane protein
MKKQENALAVLRFVRSILLIDLSLAMLVALACFFLDLWTFKAYGTVLVWVGVAVIVFAALTGVGGFASRVEDITAFSLSGAGNMFENLRQITDARQSNLGCFLLLALAGIGLIAMGYLIQVLAAFI